MDPRGTFCPCARTRRTTRIRWLVPVGHEWYDAAFDDSEVETKASEQLARDGDRQDAVVSCSEDEVRLGIGPDIDTARAIVQ